MQILHPDECETCSNEWANRSNRLHPTRWSSDSGKRGEYRWHLSRAIPIFDETGQVKSWFGTTTDIHEQKAEEEILDRKVFVRTAELQNSYALLKLREDDLRRSLSQRNILFREVHYREKNNLQVISSLLRMQGDSLKSQPAAATALEESQRRVLSMAMIHKQLYANQSIDNIDFADYTRTLVKDLIYSYSLPGKLVEFRDRSRPGTAERRPGKFPLV